METYMRKYAVRALSYAMKSENGRQYQKRMRKWIVMMSNVGMDFYIFISLLRRGETIPFCRHIKDAESFIYKSKLRCACQSNFSFAAERWETVANELP